MNHIPNSPLMPMRVETMISEFVASHGATHPWVLLCFVTVGALFLVSTDSDYLGYNLPGRMKRAMGWCGMSYAFITAGLHAWAVFVLQSHGLVWHSLAVGIVVFGWKILWPLLWYPLQMWAIFLPVSAVWALFVHMRSINDAEDDGIQFFWGVFVFDIFVVITAFVLGD